MAKGDTFRNGEGLRCWAFNHHEVLTVVRRDIAGYGVDRYIVRDSSGRHGYAY